MSHFAVIRAQIKKYLCIVM